MLLFWCLMEVELANYEMKYLAEAISKQSTEDEAWILLNAHRTMWEERNDLKMELAAKQRQSLQHGHILSLPILQKLKSVFGREH